jgi:hypothetical protein
MEARDGRDVAGHYEVADPDRFLEAFDGFEGARKRAGATTAGLVRSSEDPRTLVALIEFASREAAEGFAASPERIRTLEDAGVSTRTDELFEVVRPIVAV